jgi:SSS family solute:Na+ symporter
LALAGIGLAGLLATRGKKGPSVAEYFLAGQGVGWLALGISLSVTTLWALWSLSVGMPASFGLLGWAIPGVIVIVGLLFLGIVFAPRYLSLGVATIPSYLKDRYGRGVGFGAAVISIVLTLLIRIPFTIFVGSRLLSALWAWDPMSSALLMIIVPGLFVVAGGYRAVIATQYAGGIAAGLGLLVLAFKGFSIPTIFVQRLLPGADLSWVFVICGAAVVGFWYTCFDQFVVQRAFAARSCAAIRGGAGLAALLVVLGVVALSIGFTNGVSPASQGLNGDGVTSGFIGAAIIAFAMASLAGHFMSVATLFTTDLYLAGRKKRDEATLVLVGRLTNTVVVFLAILTASSVGLMGSGSLEWMAHAFAITVPPIAAVTMIGLLWPRMHGRGALWALIIGWAAGLFQIGISPGDIGGMMQGIVLTFACSSLVFVAVSLTFASAGLPESTPETMLRRGLQVRKQ